ncbi:MAG: metallophosphoesterase family protein [Miltoncostaeaceae bacterium]
MRIAVITDIHANLAALEAVLAAIDDLRVNAAYCGGDLVGYGPDPNAVCALIRDREIPTIYGNYDHAIARDDHDCGCAYRDPADKALGERSIAWTLEHTSDTSKEFMRDLPFDLRFAMGGRRVRLVHGSPRKVNEYLFDDKPDSLYERLAVQSECDVLVFGHTHKPWISEIAGVLFVNCGSVGKPKDGDPRAAFAVLELKGDRVTARIERARYDAASVAREVAAVGLPHAFGDRLLTAS